MGMIEELIARADPLLRDGVEKGSSDKERLLLRLAKLTEEVGELSQDILLSLGNGRKEKVDTFTPSQLEDEFADVIICTYLLAKSASIDIDSAVKNKFQKIKERR